MSEHIISNLITGQHVVGFNWESDRLLVWGYDRSQAVRFGSKANAEVANREDGGIGWVVPA